MLDLERIADNANMIVNGYAFTAAENGRVRVLNLNAPDCAAVLSDSGEALEMTMDDIELGIVQRYYCDNREFMEANHV